MREIKFRVWYQGKMHNLGDIYEAYFIDGAYLEHSGHNGDEPVFMQYTGLKDKNGAEIYEGDVIRVLEDSTEFDAVISWNFNYASFACYLLSDGEKEIYCDHLYGVKYFEVIGNVYENPEILK